MVSRVLFSTLVCVIGLAYGGRYLLHRGERDDDRLFARWAGVNETRKRRRRRTLGASLMIMTSIAFFLGVNVVSPRASVSGFVAFWAAVGTRTVHIDINRFGKSIKEGAMSPLTGIEIQTHKPDRHNRHCDD